MMASTLEQLAAKVTIGQSGQEGTKALFLVDDNKIVTSANMKVGAYTVAAQPTAPALLSVTHTQVGGVTDTLGTIDFVGTDINGDALTETVTPVDGTTVYTVNEFKTVTSATGVGWVIDTTEDTIIIGVSSVTAPTGFYFSAIQVLDAAVVLSQTAKTGFLVADFSLFTSMPVGVYPTKLTKIALTSGEAIGYLTKDN